MAQYTPYGNLYLPDRNDKIAVDQSLADNFTKIDDLLDSLNNSLKPDRLPFVYMKDYNAMGDYDFNTGVGTDDTDALQAAINDAGLYGTLFMEENKNYRTTQTLTAFKIKIVGRGSSIVADHTGYGILGEGILKDTVTVTNQYEIGDDFISLSSSSNVEYGDILNIVSTEPYTQHRTYYYKGGNVLAARKSGNNVYMSMPFPMDMAAASITVKVYEPGEVYIDNLDFHQPAASAVGYGVYLSYCKNSKVENSLFDNFEMNLRFNRCVNCIAETVEVNRAGNYGIANYSCTNLHLVNVSVQSGRHGYTSGGNEVVYGTYIENSMLANGLDDTHAFDSHGNCYSMTVVGSTIHNFSVHGNVTFKNCTFFRSGSYGGHFLPPADDPAFANYTFEDCTWAGTGQTIETSGNQIQVTPAEAPNYKYIGKIVFRNCKGIERMNFSLIDKGGVDHATIGQVIIDDCDGIDLRGKDNVEHFVYRNSTLDRNTVMLYQEGATFGKWDNVYIENCGIPNRANVVQLHKFDNVWMTNCYFVEVGATTGTITLNDINGKAFVTATDFTDLAGSGGLNVPDGLNRILFLGSQWKMYSSSLSRIGNARVSTTEPIV